MFELIFDYWFMFAFAIVIATAAMTLGVGGAIFFSPVFIILFPLLEVPTLTPATAFGAALLTEVFGFTSGVLGYSRKKLIDYKTALGILFFTIPLAIIGTIIKRLIEENLNEEYLNLLFGLFLFFLAYYIFSSTRKPKISATELDTLTGPKRVLIDAQGTEYNYKVCNQTQGRLFSGSGGFLTGLISVGIGETVVSTLRIRCNLPMKIATGTSVLVVTLTVLTAAIFDILYVVFVNNTNFIEAVPWSLVLFTIPGVIIGGQIGPRIASNISSEKAESLLISIFIIFGFIMSGKAIISLL